MTDDMGDGLTDRELLTIPFEPPSIHHVPLLAGETFTHHSQVPAVLRSSPNTPVTLGIDEAGRGPVLGPMVYGCFYLPNTLHTSLLKDTHRFMDSKVLTPAMRLNLMQKICSEDSDLYEQCGWATTSISARDIAAHMLSPARYNLNAQAMDATIALIQQVIDKGVEVTEIYIDTIGQPAPYQKRLEKIFPRSRITVAKKADSLYPVVSAASVCAKVTRDIALDICWREQRRQSSSNDILLAEDAEPVWGSGYPSDARCSTWLKQDMHPLFGWSNVCRFSWGTAQDLLEKSDIGTTAVWPNPEENEEDDNMRISNFVRHTGTKSSEYDEMRNWYGQNVGADAW